MTVAELHALIAVVDGLGEHALAASLAGPASQEALVDALLLWSLLWDGGPA